MFDQNEFSREFFDGLTAIDEVIVAAVAAATCRHCGGPLHRGDYHRKPRWGVVVVAGEVFARFARRYSLCCGREGCRRRTTPPSVRFLGRRVYVGAVMIVASVLALAAATASAGQRATGVPPRTTRRWLRWWRGPFPEMSVFMTISALLLPAVERARLPASLLERMPGSDALRLTRLLAWLSPLTTTSTADGARFVRGLV